MDLVQMENVQGGDAETIICNSTCIVLGGIFGLITGAILVPGSGFFAGALVSVTCGEI